jgi:hypothetical protein
MEIPESSNLYGLVDCRGRMEAFAAALRKCRGANVRLKVSQFNGDESVRMSTADSDLEAYKSLGNEYLFNGAVAGDMAAIQEFATELHDILREAEFRSRFELTGDEGAILAAVGDDFKSRS